MDGRGIAAKVAYGYAKSAQKLGLPHTQYRPSGPLRPALSPECRMRTVSFVASATPDATFSRPNTYGKAALFGLLDARLMQASDYLDGDTGTWFIASLQADAIPLVVQCNATISIVRGAGNTAAGVQPYGGRRTSTDVPLMTGWPASVLAGGKQEAGRADLPGDVTMKGYTVLLPAWPGVTLRTSDRIVSSTGEVMTIAQAEVTDLGYRIQATMSEV